MKKNKPQKAYFRGLGIFVLTIAVCQILYLLVAVNEHLYADEIPIFKEDQHYDYWTGTEWVRVFRSFWFFNEDKFVLTFFLLFISLPFLTRPMEKYIMARKHNILTTICLITAPAILIVRVLERNLYEWFGIPVLNSELSGTGAPTTAYIVFSGFWIATVAILFTVILLLIQLYLLMGRKTPTGSKLRKKSKLISFGLIFYVIAIVTTQNAAKELLDMSVTAPIWGWLTYIFGYSTPIFLTITLVLLRLGFRRET